MFSFLHKKSAEKSIPLKKKTDNMKCRKMNYVDEDFDGLAESVKTDISAIMRLKPVNYYATKTKYIMAKIYTNEDYSENYIQLFRYENEHKSGESDIFPIDKELLSRFLAKVGIIINV